MNRYRTLTTDDPAIAVLDTIIRFPVELEDAMTPEAKAIRQKLPALIKITRMRKTKAKFIEVTTGLGMAAVARHGHRQRDLHESL
jgi:hypothetical protein